MHRYLLLLCFFTGIGVANGLAQGSKPHTGKNTVYMVSNAHLDTQWEWDVQRTIDEYLKTTLHQNFYLFEKYPSYIFNFEGAIKYKWMKEYYPSEYLRVKDYIRQGRWHISGSSLDANDTNIPSPESAIRNILLGQKFYEKEFGVLGTDIFLPDCFGFSYTLPSIAAHCGLIGFSTQKLQWREKPFYGQSKIPFKYGFWEGVDGARMLAVLDGKKYRTSWNNENLTRNKELIEISQSSPFGMSFRYYGMGDRGGAPTVSTVKSLEESLKTIGDISLKSAPSDLFFHDILRKEPVGLETFKGELLMDVHGTGCYTSQAAVKMYNRKCEILADAAERSAVIADWMGGMKYPAEKLNDAWTRFIWHQFHDDITGTSIPDAYRFTWNDQLISQLQFASVISNASAGVAQHLHTNVKGTPVIVYNPLAVDRKDIVEVTMEQPDGNSFSVVGPNGMAVPAQIVKGEHGQNKVIFSAQLKPLSYAVYEIIKKPAYTKSFLKISSNQIENEFYRVSVDSQGNIYSIFHKGLKKELIEKGKSVRLCLFTNNHSERWPAWEIMKSTIDTIPEYLNTPCNITIEEEGPVRVSLRIERAYKGSVIVQKLQLTCGGNDERIDIINDFEWNTRNCLVKVEFPLTVKNESATYDLGLGTIRRGNNSDIAYEVPAQYWANIEDGNSGVSILNDSKYGWDKPADNVLRLTLLHIPHSNEKNLHQINQDLGHHQFKYSIYAHDKNLVDSKTIYSADLLNNPVIAFISGKHPGKQKEFSFLQCPSDNLSVKALKKAEDGDFYVIRLYETKGRNAGNAQILFPADILEAKELNGIEEETGEALFEGNKLIVNARPYQVKTYGVKLKKHSVSFSPVLHHLPLNYTHQAWSHEAFKKTVNFDGKGNSFAAELIPEIVQTGTLSYKLGNADENHAIKCAGNKITLPAGIKATKLCFLAASVDRDRMAGFYVDSVKHNFYIPCYTGFMAQWGHTGFSHGFFKKADIAFIGTHRHHPLRTDSYIYTYMFQYMIDIPEGAKEFILPDNNKIALFAVTLVENAVAPLEPASDILSYVKDTREYNELDLGENLVKEAKVIARSGKTKNWETPQFAFDEDETTKWYDADTAKIKFFELDLGKPTRINRWKTTHDGLENPLHITREYSLWTKENVNDTWVEVDRVTENTEPITDRRLQTAVLARFIRLQIINGEQKAEGNARICELAVF